MLHCAEGIFLVKTNKKLVNNRKNHHERIHFKLTHANIYHLASHRLRRSHFGLLCGNYSPTASTSTPPPTIPLAAISIDPAFTNSITDLTIKPNSPNTLTISGECGVAQAGSTVEVRAEATATHVLTNTTTCRTGSGQSDQDINPSWTTTFTSADLTSLQTNTMRAIFTATTTNTAGVPTTATNQGLFVQPNIPPRANAGNATFETALQDIHQIGDVCRAVMVVNINATAPIQYVWRVAAGNTVAVRRINLLSSLALSDENFETGHNYDIDGFHNPPDSVPTVRTPFTDTLYFTVPNDADNNETYRFTFLVPGAGLRLTIDFPKTYRRCGEEVPMPSN